MANALRVFHRAPGNYDGDVASEESGLECTDASRTVQSDAIDADINTIVRRFGLTGMMPQAPVLPAFKAFEDVFDFRSAMDVVLDAQRNFMELPADVRKQFENDPQQYLEFCSDEKNRDEMKRLGLLKPPPPEPTIPLVRVLKEEEGDKS